MGEVRLLSVLEGGRLCTWTTRTWLGGSTGVAGRGGGGGTGEGGVETGGSGCTILVAAMLAHVAAGCGGWDTGGEGGGGDDTSS